MRAWKSIGIAAAAMMLVTGPMASAQSTNAASKLSLTQAPTRSGTPAQNSNELRGGFIIPLVAVVAIILGILAFTGSSSSPHSP